MGLNAEDAFRSFDKDFDGVISKSDLKWGLENLLQLENIT
jgi:Ca2+-binding EF-hand superfamily protein